MYHKSGNNKYNNNNNNYFMNWSSAEMMNSKE